MRRSHLRAALLVALIALTPGSLLAFGKNKIAYDQFEWKIYNSTHFEIYFYEDERDSLQKVVNMAESAYDDLSRKFNFQISDRIPLIYYHTHSAFSQTNVFVNFIPEGVGAFAEPVKNRMVLPIDMPDEKLYQLVKHELTHIFEYEIFFQGQLAKSIRANPPQWLMEGLASFMAADEDARDRMVLRDAVVNDTLPSITQNPQGFFAYRYGHAVFRFMQERFGWDGLRDFIYEYRSTLGNSVEKPLRRAFDMTPEEFNTAFRTWLRKQYLPALITKGEPTEYGRRFRVSDSRPSQELSPVPSPSGDLLLAMTTYKEDVDIALFNVPERKLMRNLTSGYPDEYEYIIAQSLTTGPVMGRDVAFSPDGDRAAFFVKKERGRNLMIINSLTGAIERSIEMKQVEQQLNPVYTPDGRGVAFHAIVGNQADIFLYDLSTGELTNLTNDDFYDAAPAFSPDGRWLVYSSEVDGYAKLFRLDLSNPTRRYQLTQGEWNDIDAWYSPSGERIYYASDRLTGREKLAALTLLEQVEEKESESGEKAESINPDNFAAFNVYSLDLPTGDIRQYTDVVGGALQPVSFIGEDGKEFVVFASYYKQRWDLYRMETDRPLRTVEKLDLPTEPVLEEERQLFLPPVEVALDDQKIEDYGKFKLFIEHVDVNAGVNSDQTFVSRSIIYMSDMLGNRRFVASLDSVSTFSNFDFLYLDMTKRMNWGVRLFDDRSFFVTPDFEQGRLNRRRIDRSTGLIGLLSYPFDRYHRVDFGAGWIYRDIDFPQFVIRGDELVTVFEPRQDDYPVVTSTFTGDSAVFKQFGPISGRRYTVSASYAPDLDESGTLTSDFVVDFRQYLQVTSRSLLAARAFAGYSDGNFPNFYYFGGLNTLRGFDFRTLAGNRAFFANFEYRFPLIDYLVTPVIGFRDIRGSLFFDIGGAYFDGEDFKFQTDGTLVDGKAAVGYGISVNVFGLELHWDFARRTDLDSIDKETRTTFWIGSTF